MLDQLVSCAFLVYRSSRKSDNFEDLGLNANVKSTISILFPFFFKISKNKVFKKTVLTSFNSSDRIACKKCEWKNTTKRKKICSCYLWNSTSFMIPVAVFDLSMCLLIRNQMRFRTKSTTTQLLIAKCDRQNIKFLSLNEASLPTYIWSWC